MAKDRILIIDSKPFIADVITETFSDTCECIWRTEVNKLEIASQKPSAIILGTNVCIGDDREKQDTVKKAVSATSVPVVVLTSNQLSKTRIADLEAGAWDVMTKPFNPMELKVRVLKLIGRNR